MNRTTRILWILGCVWPWLVACGPVARDALEPVPEPDLSNMSESASALFEEEQTRLRELLQDLDSGTALLALTFGRLGEIAHAGQRIEMAGACYRNAQRLEPKDPRWPYYLGHLHHFAGEWDNSIENFERALELSPDDQPTLIHLAQVFLERGETARAGELFRRAVGLGDPSSSAAFGLGQVRFAEGDFPAAAEHFEQVLARVPAASRIHYHLGVVYGRLGDRELAASHMARQGPGLPQPPDHLMDEVRRLRELIEEPVVPGSVALSEGRFDDALAELRVAEAADPTDPVVQLGLGTTLGRKGELEQAERHYRAAIRLANDRRMTQNASLNLGGLLESRGRWAEALEHYRTVIELDPDSEVAGQARLSLVRALVSLGRPHEGEEHFRALLESGPQDPTIYVSLGELLGENGAYASARWVFDRGRDAHPHDALIANSMARFLSTCPDDGARDGAEALRLASSLFAAAKSGPHAATLAMALAENGRFEEAAEVQRAAIADAERQGRTEVADRLRQWLQLYEAGKPLRRGGG